MAKDPAFLMYTKDWLQGTSQLMPDEKGVYIDLLCHQHQEGSLPVDTRRLSRMVGLQEAEFLPIWDTIKHKFVKTVDDRLVNQKLTNVMTERSTKSLTNKISGEFAALIRLSDLTQEEKEKIKKQFHGSDFSDIPAENLREKITKWFNQKAKSVRGSVNGSFKKH